MRWTTDNDLRTTPDDQYGMILPPVQLFGAVMHWKWDTISDDWKLNNRIIDITYDSAYNLTHYTVLTWKDNVWVNSVQRSLSYDERNNQTLAVYQGWNGTDIIATDELANTDDQIIIYPNLSGGKFAISKAEADVVEVFSVAGKRVYAAALSTEQASIEMDMTHLGSGIYFVVLHNGNKIHSRKIEIQ